MFRIKWSIWLLVLVQVAISQKYIIPDLQRDDFDGTVLKSWWEKNIDPEKYSDNQLNILNGYLEAILKDPIDSVTSGRLTSSSEMENIGFSTIDNTNIYDKDLIMTAIIRVKAPNTLPPGTRGWGFWRSEGIPIIYNEALWFFDQYVNPDSVWASRFTYWRAQLLYGVGPNYASSTDLSTDIQTWHTYMVKRYSGSVADGYYEHYIDGVLIQRRVPSDLTDSSLLINEYSFHVWNDNLNYIDTVSATTGNDTIEVFYNGWFGTSKFIVDYVEIIKNDYDPSYTVQPVDASDFLRLRAYENEIDDGLADGLWKSYTFETNAGNTFIIVTAKAENYDTYDDDDDLKIVVDGTDYGYDNLNSWNGDVDDALPKTLVFTPTLSAGSHTLEVYSQTTPILYDVNVLNSLDGTLVLDQTLNETAPTGSSNYLWKQFSFSCDAGPIAIFVSASADEEPGWNHLNADIDSTDDDELRIVLDNTDFGWAGDYGFEGNALFGDVKTVLIKDTVAAGTHTLKFYVNESPTVYRVIVFAENGDYSLPVLLSSFTVERTDKGALITWTTESEVDVLGFNVLRAQSADSLLPHNISFQKINETIIPAQGSSSQKNYYYFTDRHPVTEPFVWYRLEVVDLQGQKTPLAPLKVVTAGEIFPEALHLWPNFPNPFNPVTHIRFALKKDARVTIEIFNLRGQKIRTLWNQVLKAGEHQFSWNGTDEHNQPQSSGVYFYRVSTPSAVKLGKMTLLK